MSGVAGAASASIASGELEAEILAIGRALAPKVSKGSRKPSRLLDESCAPRSSG